MNVVVGHDAEGFVCDDTLPALARAKAAGGA
jgi:hypothetical protein